MRTYVRTYIHTYVPTYVRMYVRKVPSRVTNLFHVPWRDTILVKANPCVLNVSISNLFREDAEYYLFYSCLKNNVCK